MLRQYILSIPIWTMSKKIFIKTIRWKTYCMSRMNSGRKFHPFTVQTFIFSSDTAFGGKFTNLFQKIEVTCPAVSSIIPKSAEIVLADNGTHTTTIAQVSPSGNYSFIVPPVGNMVIAINMVTNGKKYTTQLETKSFTGNKEYTYHLKISEKLREL